MDRDAKLFDGVCMPIYQELFKKAEPSANFKKMLKTREAYENNFYMKYYLSMEKITDIIEKHIKKHTKRLRIKPYEKEKIRTTILLGCSPTSAYERWEKENKK